jgi:hypothetical protein
MRGQRKFGPPRTRRRSEITKFTDLDDYTRGLQQRTPEAGLLLLFTRQQGHDTRYDTNDCDSDPAERDDTGLERRLVAPMGGTDTSEVCTELEIMIEGLQRRVTLREEERADHRWRRGMARDTTRPKCYLGISYLQHSCRKRTGGQQN